ncbi:MFS transporter [Eubacteriales bacterium OttesenSCG-928-N13]|nr:MFS transporter [Eubacteriales bacterium OttesenSCG-928-N13]
MKQKGMIATIRSLTGNARICILTEPLWGIPYNLCLPYASLYMKELGVSVAQIGMIGSLYLLMSAIASFLSGVITDKFGRKKTTFWGDVISWSIPELLWAFSQDVNWFFVATIFNGCMRVTGNSWGLLLTEDSDDETVFKCNLLAQLMGLVSVVFMLFSGGAVARFGLVPTMRVLYIVGFIMMTTKFFVLNATVRETSVGLRRMKETKNQSIWSMLWGCKDVYLHLLREKRILLTMGMIAVFQIVSRLNELFMSVYAVDHVGIAESNWMWIVLLKSLVTMVCIVLVIPRLQIKSFKRPMVLAWCVFILSQLLLICAPQGALGIAMLIGCSALEGFALCLISPIMDTMLIINADPDRRARIYGLVYGTILLGAAALPWIGGVMSKVSIHAPFMINVVMMLIGIALTIALAKARKEEVPVE